jgi:hypothetical protein
MSQLAHPVDDPDQPFVPSDFDVPLVFDTPHFHLRPLRPAVVYLDYAALMSSIDLLHAMFGRAWPHALFTRAENAQDLLEHQQEFAQRVAFAYTVRTYAVARLWANVACSNPCNSTVGSARNCCKAGRMIASLLSNQLVPLVMR